jgi:hypothetical protein
MEAAIMEMFEKNFHQWLQTSSPPESLFLDLEAVKRPGDVHFSVSDSGLPNLTKGDLFLHAQADPMAEAHEWWNSLRLKHVRVLYIYGIGLGYYYDAAQQWLKEDPRRYLVFLEDDPAVMHCFLQTEKCEAMLKDPQVMITLLSSSLDARTAQYAGMSNLFMGAPYLYTGLLAYRQHKLSTFLEYQATVSFMTTMGSMLFTETTGHGIAFFRNFFFNILELPYSYYGMTLKNTFKGVPAIICGAGPSLDKNIEVLSTLQNRALIFAGGTALNALNARNVMPHFGVGIDPNPDQFTRLISNHAYETPFLYRCRMRHEALQMVHGDHLYINGSGGYEIGKWLEEQLGNKPEELEEGFNVLNFSVLFAHLMGCNPIICVGIDLAYSEGLSYASGVVNHPIHNLRGNFRTKFEEEELISKKDIYGRPIYTLWKWIAESMWYTYFFNVCPETTLINATEGGIGFPKVPNMTLQEVKEQYLQKEYDFATRIHGEIQNSGMPPGFQLESIRGLMTRLNESLVKCGGYCEKIIELLAKQRAAPEEASTFDDKITQEHQQLIAEEAYEVMLKKFDESYSKSQELEKLRLKNEENTMTPEDLSRHKRDLDLKKYHFIKETAFLNSIVIDKALEENKAEGLRIKDPEKIHALKQRYPVPHKKEDEEQKEASFQDKNVERLDYPSGVLKLETTYSGNNLHGPTRYYSEKGALLASAGFIHGKQEGEARTYYPSGAIHSVRHFQQGLEVKSHHYFYPDGMPKSILPYKEGQLEGEVLLYSRNGTLVRRLTFLQGKKHGQEQIWNEQGGLWIESQYDHDKPIGISRMWHPNGGLAKEVHYDENSKRIEEKQWDANGKEIENQAGEDYFDQVHAQTGKLTASINEMVSTISLLAPAYEEKMQRVFFQPLNAKKEQPETTSIEDDLEKLRQEIANLQSLDSAIQTHLSGHADNPKEAIWKTPASRQEIEKQFDAVQSQMNQEMEKIQQGIKNMLGLFKEEKDAQKMEEKQD